MPVFGLLLFVAAKASSDGPIAFNVLQVPYEVRLRLVPLFCTQESIFIMELPR